MSSAPSKPKAPQRDYQADMRPRPLPPDDATDEELWDRGHEFVKAVLAGAGTRRKPEPTWFTG